MYILNTILTRIGTKNNNSDPNITNKNIIRKECCYRCCRRWCNHLQKIYNKFWYRVRNEWILNGDSFIFRFYFWKLKEKCSSSDFCKSFDECALGVDSTFLNISKYFRNIVRVHRKSENWKWFIRIFHVASLTEVSFHFSTEINAFKHKPYRFRFQKNNEYGEQFQRHVLSQTKISNIYI